jgi:hypothetical protein
LSALGESVDPIDFDVREPGRPASTALDYPAAKTAAEIEREVATGRGPDQFRSPVQQSRQEGSGPHLIACV